MNCANLQIIVDEINEYSQKVSQDDVHVLAENIKKAKRIFVAGAGRSGFAARGFSNRLMHLGLTAYFVGEPTTPAIANGDILIVGSGSGTTASLAVNAEKAKKVGAKLATITIFPQAKIGQLADVIVQLPGATPKRGEGEEDSAVSVQPMGSLFEQLSWLTYDATIMELMTLLGETSDTMFPRHANLE
jgi:6-phospho-3-hexuloisomerase